MKFIEFWDKLDELLIAKSDFVTMDQKKPFKAKRAIEAVAITSDTIKDKRVINKDEFAKIWFLSQKLPESETMKPVNYSKDTVNASYIVTLFDAVLNS